MNLSMLTRTRDDDPLGAIMFAVAEKFLDKRKKHPKLNMDRDTMYF